MHLVIDGVGHKLAGVATVLLDTVAAAIAMDDVSRLTVLCTPRSVRSFDLPASPKLREVEEPLAENVLLRHWWYERGLARRVSSLAPDVVLCLHSAGLTGLAPHVTFVQRPLTYTEEARSVIPLRHRYRTPLIRPAIRRSCKSAARVVVQTPTMARSVARLFGVPDDRIEVVLPSPRPLPLRDTHHPALASMRDSGRPRFLFVGQLVTHKNARSAISAVNRLRGRLPGARLFVTGPPAHDLGDDPSLVYLGFVSDSALSEAYRLADALVMPSLHETVGLPMLEAMDAGTPVLAADRPYAHDVCEDAALFFDPLDPDDISATMVRLLDDPQLRADLVHRGIELIVRRRDACPYRRLVESALDAAKP